MTRKVTVYHNPRCSKSREVMKYLEAQGVQVHVVEYLKAPLTEDELAALVRRLGIAPHDLVRTKEPIYRQLGLDADAPDDVILRAMSEHPILMERPVVVTSKGAVIGRPLDRIHAIL